MSRPVWYGTCEHAGHEIPVRWRDLFKSKAAQALLHSHRGWDIGILPVARQVSRTGNFPLRIHRITRLLADTNRSPGHPALFSPITRTLSPEERQRILDQCYMPHRAAVESELAAVIQRGAPVLHVGFHSFTPVMEGEVRRTGIGILYDPSRAFEKQCALTIRDALRDLAPGWRIHLNAPYRGTADGLVTHLRKRWPDEQYGGIELEVNQNLLGTKPQQQRVADCLSRALEMLGER